MSAQALSRPLVALLPLLGCVGCTLFQDLSALTPAQAQRPTLVIDWDPATAWAAKVTVACAIDAAGRPTGCTIRHLVGNPAFGPSALAFTRALIFTTGFASGDATPITNYAFKIGFQPKDQFAPPGAPPSLAYAPPPPYTGPPGLIRPGSVTLRCTITERGDTEGCAAIARDGPPALTALALALAAHAHYLPGWRAGAPVATPNHTIQLNFLPPDHFPGLPGPDQNPGHGIGEALRDTTPVYARQGPIYPTESAYAHHGGSALVACQIPRAGPLRHCHVLAVHGDAAFGPAARRYLSQQVLRLTRRGKPATAPYWRIIRFSPLQDHW